MSSQLFLKTKTVGYYMVQNANQLLYSQLFSNAAWVKTNITLTAGQTDPSAGTEAFTLTAGAANATMLQSVALTGTLNRTFSIYLKRKTGTGNISITVDGATYVVKTTTGSWARFDTTLTASGTVTAGIKITTSGDEVYAAWAQLEDGVASTYATNTANRYTVTQITDADYPSNTTRGCVFLDGRFFVMNVAGEIYQSALENAASWSALEFIGTQIEPDQGVYLAKHNNYLAAFKQYSTEFFYDAANATGSILSPVQNAAFKVGCASDASVKEMAGTVVWMGQTKDGFGRGIFRLNGMAPEKISTPQIDKILNADSLATVYSWSCNVGSHLLYGLTLVTTGVTLVYDFTTQLWSFFTYLTSSGVTKTVTAVTAAGVVTSAAHGYSDGDIVLIAATNADFNGWHVATDVTTNTFQLQATGTAFSGSGTSVKHTETYFPVIASTSANGKQYLQHATNGKLFEFSQSTYIDDVGAIAARIKTPKIDNGTSAYKTMGSAEIVGDKISSVAVMNYTDDDWATYSYFRPVDLSIERSNLQRMGRYSRRAFQILHVKNALLRLEAIEIESS
jgi:hypothetical protein